MMTKTMPKINLSNPVFPSILSTNFFDLESKLSQLSNVGVEYIHLDVMDGNFVTNISFGPSILTAIKSKFPFKVDAHLMVRNPQEVIPWFIEAGADWISFHIEAGGNSDACIEMIRQAGCRAGIVLNPDTPVEQIFPFLDRLDYVLFMSVFPGYGGQSFIPDVLDKIRQLNEALDRLSLSPIIQIDGGINDQTIGRARELGVQSFVVGTYLYNSENISNTIAKLKGV